MREKERATWCKSRESVSERPVIWPVDRHCLPSLPAQGTPFGSEMKEREGEGGFTIGSREAEETI